ncbi:MAG: hypothetical protein AAF645_10555 [Myxococcota bacterium]
MKSDACCGRAGAEPAFVEAAGGPVADSLDEDVGEGWLGDGEGDVGARDGGPDVGGFGEGVEFDAGFGAIAVGDLQLGAHPADGAAGGKAGLVFSCSEGGVCRGFGGCEGGGEN